MDAVGAHLDQHGEGPGPGGEQVPEEPEAPPGLPDDGLEELLAPESAETGNIELVLADSRFDLGRQCGRVGGALRQGGGQGAADHLAPDRGRRPGTGYAYHDRMVPGPVETVPDPGSAHVAAGGHGERGVAVIGPVPETVETQLARIAAAGHDRPGRDRDGGMTGTQGTPVRALTPAAGGIVANAAARPGSVVSAAQAAAQGRDGRHPGGEGFEDEPGIGAVQTDDAHAGSHVGQDTLRAAAGEWESANPPVNHRANPRRTPGQN